MAAILIIGFSLVVSSLSPVHGMSSTTAHHRSPQSLSAAGISVVPPEFRLSARYHNVTRTSRSSPSRPRSGSIVDSDFPVTALPYGAYADYEDRLRYGRDRRELIGRSQSLTPIMNALAPGFVLATPIERVISADASAPRPQGSSTRVIATEEHVMIPVVGDAKSLAFTNRNLSVGTLPVLGSAPALPAGGLVPGTAQSTMRSAPSSTLCTIPTSC